MFYTDGFTFDRGNIFMAAEMQPQELLSGISGTTLFKMVNKEQFLNCLIPPPPHTLILPIAALQVAR